MALLSHSAHVASNMSAYYYTFAPSSRGHEDSRSSPSCTHTTFAEIVCYKMRFKPWFKLHNRLPVAARSGCPSSGPSEYSPITTFTISCGKVTRLLVLTVEPSIILQTTLRHEIHNLDIQCMMVNGVIRWWSHAGAEDIIFGMDL